MRVLNYQDNKFFDSLIEDINTNSKFAKFNALTDDIKKRIILTIIQSQSRALKFCIENRLDCHLPQIGSFRIKPEKLHVLNRKQELLKKYGVSRLSQLSASKKEDFKNELADILRDDSKEYRKNKEIEKNTTPEVVRNIGGLNKFIINSKKSCNNT